MIDPMDISADPPFDRAEGQCQPWVRYRASTFQNQPIRGRHYISACFDDLFCPLTIIPEGTVVSTPWHPGKIAPATYRRDQHQACLMPGIAPKARKRT